ncbi:MAG TPA: hypothetical protein VGE93_02235, partial [Bryobacteraceae bacterium]
AWASLILGTSLLGQRIRDVLAIVQAVKNTPEMARKPLALAARGRLTVPALFAFAVNQDLGSLYLAGGLTSFKSVLETEQYAQPLANFAWDLFRFTDLPELAAQSAPRLIHVAGAVDGGNRRVNLAEIKPVYTSGNVRFSSEPKWDATSLASV